MTNWQNDPQWNKISDEMTGRWNDKASANIITAEYVQNYIMEISWVV